jgi:lambda repressor-like predicted transcriptional regulator
MPDPKRPLPYAEVDIDEVRKAANRRADATSVRQLSRETGINHTTLEKFLAGATPFAKTRIPLCEWYLGVQSAKPPVKVADTPQRPDPASHLEALLADLGAEARTEARIRIATALSQAYARMGRNAPDWLYTTQ